MTIAIFITALQVNAKYAGVEIPQSPIRVQVKPHVDVSKVKVDGLEPSKSSLKERNKFSFRFFLRKIFQGSHVTRVKYLP